MIKYKVKLNHRKKSIMESLGIAPERMRQIAGNAIGRIKGKARVNSEVIEAMMRECNDSAELVGVGIVYERMRASNVGLNALLMSIEAPSPEYKDDKTPKA